MATYIHRIIEVKVPEKLKGTVSYNNLEEDLINITEYKDGMIYGIIDIPWKEHDKIPNYKQWIANNPDDLSQGGKWIDLTERKNEWQLLPIWTSNMSDIYGIKSNKDTIIKHTTGDKIPAEQYKGWCDNSWVMRDHYLNNYYAPYEHIIQRGIAEDACHDVKDYMSEYEYSYGHTNILLSELRSIISQDFAKFKDTLRNTIISKKLESMDITLQALYNKVVNNVMPVNNTTSNKSDDDDDEYSEEEYDVDVIENLFEEEMGDYFNVHGLQMEVNFISGLVDMVFGYVNSDNVRIHYWFS